MRGKWDADMDQFEAFVTSTLSEFNSTTVGMWKPVTKSFRTEAEARSYLEMLRAEAYVEGMKYVHNGVFSRYWYRVHDEYTDTYTIVATSAEAIDLVDRQGDRTMCRAHNVQHAMALFDSHGHRVTFVEPDKFVE